jgi:hypothetical protein
MLTGANNFARCRVLIGIEPLVRDMTANEDLQVRLSVESRKPFSHARLVRAGKKWPAS